MQRTPDAADAFSSVPGLTSLLAYNSDATNNGSHAIRAQSRGDAITGVSTAGNGIVGQTTATPTPAPSAIFAKAGVLGQDMTTSSHNAGVAGTSTNGAGVSGTSTNDAGVRGTSTDIGVAGDSTDYIGVYGTSINNWAVRGSSNHSSGVVAESFATPHPSPTDPGNFDTAALGILGDGGAPLIIARGTGFHNDVMSLDNSGNLILKGSVTATAFNVSATPIPLAMHKTRLGQMVGTYSTHQSVPSIEDFGEGQLVNGQAYVRLDPTFAATIDPRANYLVFITPQGETAGLYVRQKTPNGFVVREYRGNSTVAFDYRIVAKPVDSNARRLPLMNLPTHGVSQPQPLNIKGKPPL